MNGIQIQSNRMKWHFRLSFVCCYLPLIKQTYQIKKKTYLPISNPFLATLQTTEAGVIIAGSVFDRSKGGTILLILLPPPVCAASAAAAALKSQ